MEQVHGMSGMTFLKMFATFGTDNSLSAQADNRKNKFSVAGKGPSYGINGSFGSPEKSLVLILVKQLQNFAWVCIIMVTIVVCLLMEKKSLSLKLIIKMLTSQLEAYLMGLLLMSLEKYQLIEMYTNFQSITMLLINLTH